MQNSNDRNASRSVVCEVYREYYLHSLAFDYWRSFDEIHNDDHSSKDNNVMD